MDGLIDIIVFSGEGWGINLFKQMLVAVVRGDGSMCSSHGERQRVKFCIVQIYRVV